MMYLKKVCSSHTWSCYSLGIVAHAADRVSCIGGGH